MLERVLGKTTTWVCLLIVLALLASACGEGDTDVAEPDVDPEPTATDGDEDEGEETPAEEVPEPRPIQIGVVPSGSAVPFIVAENEGWFERYGLEVEMVEFSSGGDLIQNVIAGGLPLGTFTVSTALDFVQRGEDVKALVLIQSRPITPIITRKELNIEPGDWEALRGLRIGITSPGSATDILIRLLLEKNGLDPESDVTLVTVGGMDGQRAALEAGEVDASLSFDPGFSLFTLPDQLNLADVFLDTRADDAEAPLPDLLQSAIVARQPFIDENTDLVRDVVRAISCAHAEMQQDPELIRQGFMEVFPGLDDEIYDNLVEKEGHLFEAEITPEAIDVVNETYVEAGTQQAPVDYEDAVATQFASEWECADL